VDELKTPLNERDHIQGSLDAPIALVEYGDYQCPDTKAAHPIVKLLQQHFGEGLCFAYRHFPLFEIHPLAMGAAEAAEAAEAQRRFWQMHDLLFQNSPDLEMLDLAAMAGSIELNLDRFGIDLATHHFLPRVRHDSESGHRSGVRGTPAFFINGLRYDGRYDLASLRGALEAVRVPG
jgi:protein-disulfide isomerase